MTQSSKITTSRQALIQESCVWELMFLSAILVLLKDPVHRMVEEGTPGQLLHDELSNILMSSMITFSIECVKAMHLFLPQWKKTLSAINHRIIVHSAEQTCTRSSGVLFEDFWSVDAWIAPLRIKTSCLRLPPAFSSYLQWLHYKLWSLMSVLHFHKGYMLPLKEMRRWLSYLPLSSQHLISNQHQSFLLPTHIRVLIWRWLALTNSGKL